MGIFVQIENPGVQYPLKVQYFYKPDTASNIANNIQTHVVSGETRSFNKKSITEDDKTLPGEVQYLVTVQDLQENRKWNERDGVAPVDVVSLASGRNDLLVQTV